MSHPSESIEDAIQDFYIALEEARRRFRPLLDLPAEHTTKNLRETAQFKTLSECASLDEHILVAVDSIYAKLEIFDEFVERSRHEISKMTDLQHEMRMIVENCSLKGRTFIIDIWTCVILHLEEALDFKQACVAQFFELTLQTTLADPSVMTAETIQDHYISYQKKVLRAHSKSFIAQIVSLRREARILDTISMRQFLQQRAHSLTLDVDSKKHILTSKQPHADTIASILGEASHLIHPLALWIQNCEPIINESMKRSEKEKRLALLITTTCQEAIQTLNKEAQSLAVTVGTWLLIDYGYIQDPLIQASHQRFFDKNSLHQPNIGDQDKPLNHLDSTLDEMAFSCQVISRYDVFWTHMTSLANFPIKLPDGEIFAHLQEISLFYATSEIDLSRAKFSRALVMAMPIEIVLGKNTFVPSVVEDAYYISTRALERASSTRCIKALSMVIHFICELWSLTAVRQEDEDVTAIGAVYISLVQKVGCKEQNFILASQQGIDKGLIINGKQMQTSSNDATFAGGFAAALLCALDTDEVTDTSSAVRSNSTLNRTLPKAPSSGSSWSRNADLNHYHLDSKFCTMNGIQAAFMACDGLVNLLDLLSDEIMTERSATTASSMLDLSKKELQAHSKAYMQLLEDQVGDLLLEYFGRVNDKSSIPPLVASLPSSPPLHRLFYHVSNENYNLDANLFQKFDDVKRVEEEWIGSLRLSRLVRELMIGKCDTHVHMSLAKQISREVATLVWDTIIQQKKLFTEWGSILLSRQVRLLEDFCIGMIHQDTSLPSESGAKASVDILNHFRRLHTTVAILQLEKPSDWTSFSYNVDESPSGRLENLTRDEVRDVMQLRIDFSADAIAKLFP